MAFVESSPQARAGRCFPVMTPDGRIIAYQRDSRLRFLSPDGTQDSMLSQVPLAGLNPMVWTSNGEFLVFQGLAEGRSDIYRINRDGSGSVNLTSDSFEGFSPVLSPDD